MSRQVSVGIIGAGMVGLSTAHLIKQDLPTAKITIYAEHFEKKTTSWGAAGVFRVEDSSFPNNTIEDVRRWSQQSMDYYWSLQSSVVGPDAGCSLFPMYQVFEEENPTDPLFKDYVKAYRQVPKEELESIGVAKSIQSGIFCHTVIVEGRYYLPYLTKALRSGSKPAKFVKQKLRTREDLANICRKHTIIVNCCGLGARKLWNDFAVYPVRGQLIRVEAPWIKFGLYAPNTTHYYPARESVVVGGLRQKDDYETNVREEDSEVIMNKIAEYLPALRHAEVKEVWTGLRPHRDGIRLEVEQYYYEEGKKIPVIHNYGHAGHGISLAHGTAVDAMKLLRRELITTKAVLPICKL